MGATAVPASAREVFSIAVGKAVLILPAAQWLCSACCQQHGLGVRRCCAEQQRCGSTAWHCDGVKGSLVTLHVVVHRKFAIVFNSGWQLT